MRELFVWYRVRDDRVAEARAAVQAMQETLVTRWPGLQARLLTRDDDAGGQTWMETYAREADAASEADGIDSALEQAIATAAHAIDALLDGTRHVEAFTVRERATSRRGRFRPRRTRARGERTRRARRTAPR